VTDAASSSSLAQLLALLGGSGNSQGQQAAQQPQQIPAYLLPLMQQGAPSNPYAMPSGSGQAFAGPAGTAPQLAYAPSATRLPAQGAPMQNAMQMLSMLSPEERAKYLSMLQASMQGGQPQGNRVSVTPQMAQMFNPQVQYGDPMAMRPNNDTIEMLARFGGPDRPRYYNPTQAPE
jgi:hypothetical protein